MIVLLSPAKSLDFTKAVHGNSTMPRLLPDSERLAKVLKKKSARSLKRMMSVSDDIAQLNVERFQDWDVDHDKQNSKNALHIFNGDVYRGLEAATFSEEDVAFAQKHVRILSGLYGLLKPLDLIQPYRLEMGTKLTVGRNKTLYAFWKNKITDLVNDDLEAQGDDILINLASNEYFKSVKIPNIKGRVVHVQFKELRNGVYKVVSFTAKVARGQMARHIVKNRIDNVEDLKTFAEDGYVYNPELSTDDTLLFTRIHEA